MALDKRALRCQKGHGAQEKGHGAAPCYFALDLTLKPVQRISIKIATNVAQQERIKCRDFRVQRSKVKVTVQCG